eukprot:GFUD01132373.1.p1 GENE.GFUD01132373.1~~GFUD01132373.1.p1  ORF type:complete len:139 (+),score=20.08 GFUD01132373.1:257-673(+)
MKTVTDMEIWNGVLNTYMLLASCLKIFRPLGLLSSNLISGWLYWRQLVIVCSAAPIMILVTIQYVPETQNHLVYPGKIEQAGHTLQWLKEDLVNASSELAITSQDQNSRVEQPDCKSVLPSKIVKPNLLTCHLLQQTL